MELLSHITVFNQTENLGFCDVPVVLAETAKCDYCLPGTVERLPTNKVVMLNLLLLSTVEIGWPPIGYTAGALEFLTRATWTAATWELLKPHL